MFLFGYGSLLSPASLGRTIGRVPDLSEMKPAKLTGYVRTWTASVEVFLVDGIAKRQAEAVFLDLSGRRESQCNGILYEASEADLCKLDVRERGYERVEVEALAGGNAVKAVTYIMPDVRKAADVRNAVVLEKYVKLVREAAELYGPEFVTGFESSTVPHKYQIYRGEYQFS